MFYLNNKIDYIKSIFVCQLVKNYLTDTDEGSTFTPGPIVEVTVTFFMYVPFAAEGLTFNIVSNIVLKFSTSFCSRKMLYRLARGYFQLCQHGIQLYLL